MKTFSYSCRDKNGAIQRGTMQADDRSGVLRELKAKGCIPLSITEAMRPSGTGLKLPPRVAALAGAAVAVVVIVSVVLFLTQKNPASGIPKVEAKTHQPHVAETVKKTNVAVKTTGVDTQQLAITPQEQRPRETPPPVRANVGTAASPKITDVKSSVDEQSPVNDELERPFKTATEQLIAMLGLPGEDTPPLPLTDDDTLEEDFKTALNNVIVVLDKDDDNSVARKENVAWIKQFIKEGQAMGWTPRDYLRELEKKRKEETALRQEAHQIMSDVQSTETTDKATTKAVREHLNKELTDQGILPLEETEE